jgi:acetyltransferase-like isoleucine patch superfamily enzyme
LAIELSASLEGKQLDIPPAFLAQGTGRITIEGTGSRVTIGPNCSLKGRLSMILGSNSTVHIGCACALDGFSIVIHAGATVEIGDATYFNGFCCLFAYESAGIRIGRDCLIAGETLLMASDMHPIADLATGTRINHALAIEVGDRVWLTARVTLL